MTARARRHTHTHTRSTHTHTHWLPAHTLSLTHKLPSLVYIVFMSFILSVRHSEWAFDWKDTWQSEVTHNKKIIQKKMCIQENNLEKIQINSTSDHWTSPLSSCHQRTAEHLYDYTDEGFLTSRVHMVELQRAMLSVFKLLLVQQLAYLL